MSTPLLINSSIITTDSGIYILTFSFPEELPYIKSTVSLGDSSNIVIKTGDNFLPSIVYLYTSLRPDIGTNLIDSLSLSDTADSLPSYLLQSVLTFDYLVDTSQSSSDTVVDSLSLNDITELIQKLFSETLSSLDISDYYGLDLSVSDISTLHLQDIPVYSLYEFVISELALYIDSSCLLQGYNQSSLLLNDNIAFTISCSLPDLFVLFDTNIPSQVLHAFYSSYLWFDDILGEELPSAFEKVLSLFIDLYFPQRFSFLAISAINCSDTIFALQDGIYTLDLSSKNPSMVSLNLSELQSSRMKRIDKIYSNVLLSKAILYADNIRYNLLGNSKFISVPKGIRAKDYKLVIENTENVEFIDVALIEERRPK